MVNCPTCNTPHTERVYRSAPGVYEIPWTCETCNFKWTLHCVVVGSPYDRVEIAPADNDTKERYEAHRRGVAMESVRNVERLRLIQMDNK